MGCCFISFISYLCSRISVFQCHRYEVDFILALVHLVLILLLSGSTELARVLFNTCKHEIEEKKAAYEERDDV